MISTPRWPSASGSFAAIADATRRTTLKVPTALIVIVRVNEARSWAEPSGPTVGPPATAPPATWASTASGPNERARSMAAADGAIVGDVAAHHRRHPAEIEGPGPLVVHVTVEHDDPHPAPDEAVRGRRAQSPGATGDQRRAAGEIHPPRFGAATSRTTFPTTWPSATRRQGRGHVVEGEGGPEVRATPGPRPGAPTARRRCDGARRGSARRSPGTGSRAPGSPSAAPG